MTTIINDEAAGSMNGFDYWATTENLKRSIGVHIQLVVATVFLVVTLRNLYHTIRLLIRFPYKLSGWCCMYAMTTGIPHHFPYGAPCKAVIWSGFLLVITTSFSLNLILIERAYLACQRNRKFAIITRNYHFGPASGCFTFSQPFMYYLRIIFDTPPNLLPSLIFIRVIYRQFKKRGVKAWRRLAREGTIVMLLVAFSNMIAIVVFASGILKNLSIIAYKLDWLFTSTVLVESTINLSNTVQRTTTTDPSNRRSPPLVDSTFSLAIQTESQTNGWTALSY
ncbi:hypothetical protein BDF22DRAFT_701872 [Syncephalis plumigaleata]|nr:hypothetical protein BDF22DRAFT_701872 [Syncephalis plumigaleata]